jgi:hypothetical protein
MGRHKKKGFLKQKMLASRIEETDYFKFEEMMKNNGKTLQEVVNLFVVSCISGTIALSGSSFVVGVKNG